jgi:protein AATF/BFR2
MKALTRDQIQSRKDKAVRFTRDVLGDPDRAEEIEDEDLEDYAERRKFTITNPHLRSNHMADGKTKAELEQEIADLEDENQELQDQLDSIADIVGGGDQDEDEEDDEDETDDGQEDNGRD